MREAYHRATKTAEMARVAVEEFLPGEDYRLLSMNGQTAQFETRSCVGRERRAELASGARNREAASIASAGGRDQSGLEMGGRTHRGLVLLVVLSLSAACGTQRESPRLPTTPSRVPPSSSPGPPVYVAWGSLNVGGTSCWRGAVAGGAFHGEVSGTRIFASELTVAEVAAMARVAP